MLDVGYMNQCFTSNIIPMRAPKMYSVGIGHKSVLERAIQMGNFHKFFHINYMYS